MAPAAIADKRQRGSDNWTHRNSQRSHQSAQALQSLLSAEAAPERIEFTTISAAWEAAAAESSAGAASQAAAIVVDPMRYSALPPPISDLPQDIRLPYAVVAQPSFSSQMSDYRLTTEAAIIASAAAARVSKQVAPPPFCGAKQPFTSPYHEFCKAQRPLMPPMLNAERERILGSTWRALSAAGRAAYSRGLTPTIVAGRGGSRTWAPTTAAAGGPAAVTSPASAAAQRQQHSGAHKRSLAAAAAAAPGGPPEWGTLLNQLPCRGGGTSEGEVWTRAGGGGYSEKDFGKLLQEQLARVRSSWSHQSE